MAKKSEMTSEEILEIASRIAKEITQKANPTDAYKIVSIVVSLLWANSARLVCGD